MKNINRRHFLSTSGSALTTGILVQGCSSIKKLVTDKHCSNPVPPVIHTTDLYHVHCDPDDHWDLSSIYALAYGELIDLKGIVIDFPVNPSLGDPDIIGITQMNYCTGLTIPSVVGAPYTMKHRNDTFHNATKIELQGIHWIISTLKNSQVPVVIHVVGTATDVAVALKKEPELFNEKCAAIYLNAGSGYFGENNNVEYNVSLDPSSFAAIFDAPCPVYWLPCVNISELAEVGEFGSYYKFLQEDILPFLPGKLKNFFTFMYGRKQNNQWLTYLNGPQEEEILSLHSSRYRNMWCTAGFLHTAGKKVTANGEIVTLESEKKPVFSFKPVSVTCDERGITSWEIKNQIKNRFIFHVDDMINYQSAMTLALKQLLLQLPG
jgi:hypothetical protein